MALRGFRGRNDFLFGRALSAVGNVVACRIIKNKYVLRHERDASPYRCNAGIGDIVVVDADCTSRWFIESE